MIFQRISEIDSIDILLFITLGMILITKIQIQQESNFLSQTWEY
ncbi:hypothetical protein LEP1GSC064_2123 [Leptospira kirschneri serovar Grippotyphosa str. Moskva]|uniref:Uncharacterized protein n=1 Tax=Leptospira kirschneri str. 200802841 TaxID=1193047 RepID=A0A828Y0I8_9LEPT|nr:hypothetical protein LEP1GSC131_0600 [Leptospira kirschneri str. 200802841]EKO59206.1 hypothetical protein LEP1GSC082_1918 [Leptospira kirschneri str. H2]EKQ82424.1 hypothetical protein LEP1GSC064_2123 [Leptospira kirschneri serovar Grippotyphosa str. Moskva]EKR07269.1 hypothetical protein LEP1GSC122_2751 [Leptospira kirschneri serovar Valbuzzi str. 200702274]EMJ92213.1 hypothetical protein LEP1GSC198_0676 [Leptospira kirschneri str. JB]EMN25868.1 hypothetical protein LEP1GSC065_1396 [Lepto